MQTEKKKKKREKYIQNFFFFFKLQCFFCEASNLGQPVFYVTI